MGLEGWYVEMPKKWGKCLLDNKIVNGNEISSEKLLRVKMSNEKMPKETKCLK